MAWWKGGIPVRVALVTATLSPRAGGLATSVPALARHLSLLNEVEIAIIGTEDKTDPDAAASWGQQVHSHRVIAMRSFHWAPGMTRTLAGFAPDITDLQGLWTYPSFAHLRYHRRFPKPYVVTPRGMLDPWALRRSPLKKRVVSALFESESLRRATCLRATSEMEAAHFRDYGLSQPIAVVPNGVEIPPVAPARNPLPKEHRRVLFLSRLHPKKGLPILLQAWAALAPSLKDWELVIAGQDEVGHEREMRDLAQRLSLPRIQWAGAVHGQEKLDLYRSADIFVLPTHAENFGLVVAEALAAAVPVISSKGAPWEGLEIEKCGWWIDQGVEPLVATLGKAVMLTDEERTQMGLRGQAWMARDFGWDKVARNMLDVYMWLKNGGQPPATVLLH